MLKRLRTVVRGEGGVSLVELIFVMLIMGTVLAALTSLFISGAKSELDQNRRFQVQEEARTAVDRMRREIHCASGVTVTSAASITVSIPAQCPTGNGTSTTTVVYDTVLVATNRYKLQRAGTRIADYLTTGNVFSYTAPSPTSLGKLHLDLPVNLTPNEGWRQWRLVTDIVLRNTVRQ